MLQSPTPYPHVGSYALLIDEEANSPAAELVRIQWRREGEYVVSFPLRAGAGGTKRVDPAKLIDGTPLSIEEHREYHDLDRSFADGCLRSAKQRRMKARRDLLRRRMIHAPILHRLLRQIEARDQQQKAA